MEDIEVGQAFAQFGQQRGFVDLRQRAVDALVVEDVHGRLIGLVVVAPAFAGAFVEPSLVPLQLAVHWSINWSYQFLWRIELTWFIASNAASML
ncbi:hypothetical protein Pres01_04640 [Metapseudomonas resinovorans]|nr:hypothetical protein Pres01_04640 [Pseudomonas resinovorans]